MNDFEIRSNLCDTIATLMWINEAIAEDSKYFNTKSRVGEDLEKFLEALKQQPLKNEENI